MFPFSSVWVCDDAPVWVQLAESLIGEGYPSVAGYLPLAHWAGGLGHQRGEAPQGQSVVGYVVLALSTLPRCLCIVLTLIFGALLLVAHSSSVGKSAR